MSLKLDHVFVCTSVGASVAEELIRFGLTEGSPNRHPGQGTANRRFFFAGAFLELLWVDDPAAAQNSAVRRTGLWERWARRDQGASPFGVCLRPAEPHQVDRPFPTWDYRPPYLPEGVAIQMAVDSQNAAVPLLFMPPGGRSVDVEIPHHPVGVREITRLDVRVLRSADSQWSIFDALERQCPAVRFTAADEHSVEFGFDHEMRAQHHDFRPKLPLVFRW